MTQSIWQRAHQETAATFDVAVVGGGIVGCSTAFWLARRRPSLSVAVVEAGTLAQGASGRNAGLVLQGTHTSFLDDVERYGRRTARRLWQFTRVNRDLLAAEVGDAGVGWRATGSLTAAGSAGENETLEASVPALRAAGAPVVHLSARETNERLQAQGFHGSLYVTSGAVADPLRLVQHVAEASGATLLTQHPVRALERAGGSLVLDTPVRRLQVGQVVLAAGPSAPELEPRLRPYVRPVRAQMLATEPGPDGDIPVPVYSHRGGYYVRQLDDGRLLAGGGRHQNREAEETGIDTTTPAVQAAIERHLHTHFPWAQHRAVEQRWSGTMGFSPDGRPVVGPLPEAPGSFFATGFTGHGMGYGFHVGRLLADLVCGTDRPDAYDLFAASRFEEQPRARAASSSSAG